MNNKFITCKICNEEVSYISGHFSLHLKNNHSLTREEYIIQTEYNNIVPKCNCGYCNDNATFLNRTNTFVKINHEHKKFNWLEEQYNLKFGNPICQNIECNNVSNFNRGIPNKYCSKKCQPGNWNQDTVKKTVKEKYGVDNVFQLKDVRDKSNLKINRKEIAKKVKTTKKKKYLNGWYDITTMQNSILEKYGVTHISKTDKFRKDASDRMKINNPMFNEDIVKIVTLKNINNLENGNIWSTKKYKDTNLYYQSNYELEFLDYCNDNNILHLIKRCKKFKIPNEHSKFGQWFIPDFYIEKINTIIEIKSSYIKNAQGGDDKINLIKQIVSEQGYNYLLILDKNMEEFKKIKII